MKISRINRKSKGHKRSWFKKDMRTSSKQKTHQICSFPEDDEILLKKAEMEKYNEGEKELLLRVMKEVRYDLEIIPPNLRYIDQKKVKAATVKINKIVSLIKTETITETNSVLRVLAILLLRWWVTKTRR